MAGPDYLHLSTQHVQGLSNQRVRAVTIHKKGLETYQSARTAWSAKFWLPLSSAECTTRPTAAFSFCRAARQPAPRRLLRPIRRSGRCRGPESGWPHPCRHRRRNPPALVNKRIFHAPAIDQYAAMLKVINVGAFGVKNGFERIRSEIRNRMCRHEKPAGGGKGSNDFAHFFAGMRASLIRLGVRARFACLAPLPDAARASKQHECERHEKHLLHDHLEQKDHGRALARGAVHAAVPEHEGDASAGDEP